MMQKKMKLLPRGHDWLIASLFVVGFILFVVGFKSIFIYTTGEDGDA